VNNIASHIRTGCATRQGNNYGILWLINRQKFLHLVLFNEKKLAPLSRAERIGDYDMLFSIFSISPKKVLIGSYEKRIMEVTVKE